MFKLAAVAVLAVATMSGCAFRTPNHDVTVSVPAIDIDVTPENRHRTHLNREWVDRGTVLPPATAGSPGATGVTSASGRIKRP
jgi:hypothetical protein